MRDSGGMSILGKYFEKFFTTHDFAESGKLVRNQCVHRINNERSNRIFSERCRAILGFCNTFYHNWPKETFCFT